MSNILDLEEKGKGMEELNIKVLDVGPWIYIWVKEKEERKE